MAARRRKSVASAAVWLVASLLLLRALKVERPQRWPDAQAFAGTSIGASLAGRAVWPSRFAAAQESVDGFPWLSVVREGVADRGAVVVWQEAAEAVAAAMQTDLDQAEAALAKAYGWKPWAQMNKPAYLTPELPDPGQIKEALKWLVGAPLSLTPEQLRFAMANSPKVYLGDPRPAYEAALEVAPEPFAGATKFKELLLREPLALKLNWNCELTDASTRHEELHCDGHCVNCWRTVTPRFLGKVLDGVEV
mmetsp:Transcript_85787/g.275881  ORF Transcript_85787/g.275881 Transcript_85787/m.275881 type:complete len:250 (-) Transcript_85787:57-806(-)